MEIQIEKRLFFEFFSRKKNQIEKTVIFRVTFHEKKIKLKNGYSDMKIQIHLLTPRFRCLLFNGFDFTKNY